MSRHLCKYDDLYKKKQTLIISRKSVIRYYSFFWISHVLLIPCVELTGKNTYISIFIYTSIQCKVQFLRRFTHKNIYSTSGLYRRFTVRFEMENWNTPFFYFIWPINLCLICENSIWTKLNTDSDSHICSLVVLMELSIFLHKYENRGQWYWWL